MPGGARAVGGDAVSKPRLLDLFCGAGGAAKGYQRAGFYVVGVDIKPQPHYCGDEFHQGDAMLWPLEGFDAIHASPPCQGYSRMRHLPWLAGHTWPRLIDPCRDRLEAARQQGSISVWVIENVEDAPLLNGVTLCGWTLGINVYRHRKFESSHLLLASPHRKHLYNISRGRMLGTRARNHYLSRPEMPVPRPGLNAWQASSGRTYSQPIVGAAGHFGGAQLVRDAMGIDWMTRDELAQAIPPAYTEFIGEQLLAALAVTP